MVSSRLSSRRSLARSACPAAGGLWRSWTVMVSLPGGRDAFAPAAEADEQGGGDEHGGQRDELGQGEREALAGEAVRQVGVGVAGPQAGPERGGQGDRRPAGGQGAGGQGSGGAAGDPEGAGPVRVGAAQPDQGREHGQVGQGEQRDGEGQGEAEVAAVVVAGHGEGGQGGDGGDQPAGQGGRDRRAGPGRDPAEAGRADAVEAGRGLGARGRHHPGEPVGDQDPEEGERGQAADQALPGAVDDEDGGQGVDEAGQAGEPVGRDDQHDGQHRDGVHDAGEDAGADDRGRDVAGRVAQLLAGGRRQLEAEEVVDQHGSDHGEHRPGGDQVAGGRAVDAVAGRVDDDGRGEEGEQPDLGGGAGQRDPLAGPQGRGRRGDRHPDEGQRHRHPPDALEGDDQPVDDGHGGDGQGAADPDGRLQEVDERDQRPGVAAEGQPRPDIGAALVGEGGAQLGDDQPGGHEEAHRHHGQQGQRLGPALGHRPQGVEDHDGRDQQADRVQPPQLPAELGPLGPGAPGDGGIGRQLHRTDRCHARSPSTACLMQYKLRGGELAVTGGTGRRCRAAHAAGPWPQHRRPAGDGPEHRVLRSWPAGT